MLVTFLLIIAQIHYRTRLRNDIKMGHQTVNILYLLFILSSQLLFFTCLKENEACFYI
jgi:hypothetical protein